MNKIKNAFLKRIAACSKLAAVKAGAVSCAGCHQPKEPEAVKKLCKF